MRVTNKTALTRRRRTSPAGYRGWTNLGCHAPPAITFMHEEHFQMPTLVRLRLSCSIRHRSEAARDFGSREGPTTGCATLLRQ